MTATLTSRHWRDFLVIVLLAVAGSIVSWRGSAIVGDALGLGHGANSDRIWFGGESADLANRVAASHVEHNRTLHHPLMVSALRLPTQAVLAWRPAMAPLDVMRLGLAVATGAWAGGLFLMCRAMGCRRLDAALLALVGLASSAVLFWSAVPEIAIFASLTILPAVAAVALSSNRPQPEWVSAGVMASALSLTVGNGLTGAIAAVMQHPWHRAAQVVVNGVCVILVLCAAQRMVFPSTGVIADHDPADRMALRSTLMTAPAEPILPFFLHSMVMPRVAAGPALSVQRSWPGSGGAAGVLALAAWAALLVIGATAVASAPVVRMRRFLAAALGGQLALQLVFGGEAFHDAPYYLPLLVALAAIGLLTGRRRTVLALAAVLLVTAVINNHGQFMRSAELARASVAQLVP